MESSAIRLICAVLAVVFISMIVIRRRKRVD
jgi:hypothetical protein